MISLLPLESRGFRVGDKRTNVQNDISRRTWSLCLIKGRKVDSGTSFVRFNDALLINSVSSMLTSTVSRNWQIEGSPVYVCVCVCVCTWARAPNHSTNDTSRVAKLQQRWNYDANITINRKLSARENSSFPALLTSCPGMTCHAPRENFFSQNCNVFSVLSTFRCNPGEI